MLRRSTRLALLAPTALFAAALAPALLSSPRPSTAPSLGHGPGGESFLTYLDPRSGEDVAIDKDTYGRHLVMLNGRREAEGLVYRRLLEVEAEHLGVSLAPDAVENAVQDQWRGVLEQRYNGNEAAMLDEFARAGFDKRALLDQWRYRSTKYLLEGLVAVASRQIDEEGLVARFEREYGQGGVRVRVRQIFLNRARMQADLVRAGHPPESLDQARIDGEIRRRLDALRAELDAGADFAALAARESHDLAARANGGLMENYNYDRYGELFADAVRAAEVGVPFGPLATPLGWHLGLVEERVSTDLKDVREELLERMRTDEAQPIERSQLRRRLVEAANLRFSG